MGFLVQVVFHIAVPFLYNSLLFLVALWKPNRSKRSDSWWRWLGMRSYSEAISEVRMVWGCFPWGHFNTLLDCVCNWKKWNLCEKIFWSWLKEWQDRMCTGGLQSYMQCCFPSAFHILKNLHPLELESILLDFFNFSWCVLWTGW